MEERTEMEVKLTAKEEKFCYEYVLRMNATKAAVNAGYSEKTAYSAGCRLLKNVKIQKRIKYLKDNLAETSGISSLRVLKEHERIAFSSIGNIHNTWIEKKEFDELTDEQKSYIQEISTKVIKKTFKEFVDGEFKDVPYDIEYVKIKLYDKQKSLDAITKMLGYDAPIKQQVEMITPVINIEVIDSDIPLAESEEEVIL